MPVVGADGGATLAPADSASAGVTMWPGEDLVGADAAGAVHALYGGGGALTATGGQLGTLGSATYRKPATPSARRSGARASP